MTSTAMGTCGYCDAFKATAIGTVIGCAGDFHRPAGGGACSFASSASAALAMTMSEAVPSKTPVSILAHPAR